MRLFAIAVLLAAPALAQYDASTLQGRAPCTATRTTGCIPQADSAGSVLVTKITMPAGTPLEFGGACMAAAAVTTPAANEYSYFLDSGNSCALTRMDSARATTTVGGGASGAIEIDLFGSATSGIGPSANAYYLRTFQVQTTIAGISKISYNIQTADNTANLYDIGVYSLAGTLLGHIGATAGTTFSPATGTRSLNFLASFTLTPGTYILALTANCGACAKIYEGPGTIFGRGASFAGSSSGGELPSSATVTSTSWATTSRPLVALWQ